MLHCIRDTGGLLTFRCKGVGFVRWTWPKNSINRSECKALGHSLNFNASFHLSSSSHTTVGQGWRGSPFEPIGCTHISPITQLYAHISDNSVVRNTSGQNWDCSQFGPEAPLNPVRCHLPYAELFTLRHWKCSSFFSFTLVVYFQVINCWSFNFVLCNIFLYFS